MARNKTTTSKAREAKGPALIAYYVVERGENSFWTRIGAAFDHKDGKGFNADLDLFPVSGGRIVFREPSEPTEERGA